MLFIVVGVIGVVLLVVSILFDDLFDAVVPDVGWVSGPIIGAFMAAFGLFGWAVDSNWQVSLAVAALAGVGGGLALGYFTYKFGMALWNMPTDATPTANDTVGTEARVVTAIDDGAMGEIVLELAGQPVKFNATADAAVERGSRVVVIAVESPTRVHVEPSSKFWGDPTAGGV